MSYREELTSFAKNIRTLQKYLKSRDTVRQSLVVPFFKILGWDVYNPGEFMAGYIFETPGEGAVAAADFAVLRDDRPAMIVQTLFGDEDTAEGFAMLAELFRRIPGDKIAILTNGIDWRFYADGMEPGVLDAEPYLTLNLGEKTRAEDLAVIDPYQKTTFDLATILSPLRLGVYEKKVAEYFAAQRVASTADRELIEFIMRKVYGGEVTGKAREKLTVWVLNAFAVIPPKTAVAVPAPAPAPQPVQELEELEIVRPLPAAGKGGNGPAKKGTDAPMAGPEGQVTVISGPDQGKTIPIHKKEFIVGRNLDLDLVLTDPSVSRRHFRIWFDNGAYWVEDLGSGNKIKVNGAKTTEKKRLANDDLIQAGNTTARFEILH